MTILTWYGKDEAVKKARKTPYRLLREVAEFSHNLASSQQPAASSQQPAASSQQPAASSQQPAASSQQPRLMN